MPKYANQERIIIGSRVPRDTKHPYARMNLSAVQDAMVNLRSIGGIKLWLYLNKNADNYTIDLSLTELVTHWGLTKDTYYKGKSELKEKGYLVPMDNSDKLFMFYESIVSENPTDLDSNENLSENPTKIDSDIDLSENPKEDMDLSENPTNIGGISENPTDWNIGGFYF